MNLHTCNAILPMPRGGRCNEKVEAGAGTFCPACEDRARLAEIADAVTASIRQEEVDAAWARFNRVGPLEFDSGVDAEREAIEVAAETTLTGTRLA